MAVVPYQSVVFSVPGPDTTMSTTRFRYGLVTGSRGQPAAEELAVEFMFSDGYWGIKREIVTRDGRISRKFPSEKDQYPTIEKWPDPDEAIRAGMMRPLSPDAFERYWNMPYVPRLGLLQRVRHWIKRS